MKTRVAVIGSGFGLYGVLPAFQRIPACSVAGISGIITDRLVNYCKQTAVPYFEDWRGMIEQCKPDALAVAVIPKYQPEIIRYAFQRGISVLAEKPLALNLDDARDLLARAKAGKQAHMVDFLFPEIPEWKQAREMLAQGAIGQTIQVTVNWSFLSYDLRNQISTWKTRSDDGGGALSFYFSHMFYNLEFFLGRLQSLYCSLNYSPQSPNKGETVVNLFVKFAGGCTGNILFNCSSFAGNRHVWEFQGEKGNLVLENHTKYFGRGFELSCYDEAGKKRGIEAGKFDLEPDLDERVPLVRSLGERFIDWCQGSAPSKPDFEDGFRVQELIERSRLSFEHNQIVTA